MAMNMVIAATTTTTREVQRRIALYDSLAAENGWTKVKITTDNSRVQRQRYKQMRHGGGDGDEMVVVDCWPTTGVIGSYLKHPKQGKTQLFRKECSDEEVAKVFVDPRSHTGKGYQRRPENDDRKKREREGKVTDDETSNDDRSADETAFGLSNGPNMPRLGLSFFSSSEMLLWAALLVRTELLV